MRLSTEAVLTMLRRAQDNDTLGGRIWRARDALGMSTRELADRLGVHADTVSAWERDRTEPRTSRLFMLAGVLGVTPAWLIAGLGEAPRDELNTSLASGLSAQLENIRSLHEQTGKAIAALEAELARVLQDIS